MDFMIPAFLSVAIGLAILVWSADRLLKARIAEHLGINFTF